VSSAGFDDIGSVLQSMGIAFEPFRGTYDCDLLFVNCGTKDAIDQSALRAFVEHGGCLYISDLMCDVVAQTFPGMFQFGGRGQAGNVTATVVDTELSDVIGSRTTIHFDLSSWAMLDSCRGDVLVAASDDSAYPGRPLMVEVGVDQGVVFYTSFHNRAQASAKEIALMQLLVLKQLSASSGSTLEQTSSSLGINLAGFGLRRRQARSG
jgi:hypothetical protein